MHTRTYRVTDHEAAKDVITDTLSSRGYSVRWSGPTGTAELGDWVNTAFAGGLAPHCRVGLHLVASKTGPLVRLEQLSSGGLGGRIGARRTHKAVAGIAGDLHEAFSGANLTRGLARNT
jgi:hypothetical protein